VLGFYDFESGTQGWDVEGSDVALRSDGRNAAWARSGTFALRIRDDTTTSDAESPSFDVSAFSTVEVTFWYRARGFEQNEDFVLEYLTGTGWSNNPEHRWICGADFENKQPFKQVVASIDVTTSNVKSAFKIRFRCDASENNDRIYIDDVEVKGFV